MNVVFKTNDYEGTPVVLSHETWQTKAGNGESGSHPEIRAYLSDIQATIEQPDLVFQSQRDERSRVFYRLEVGRDLFKSKHLVVIVKYVSESTGQQGYVSTIYLSRSIYTQGALLCQNLKHL